MGGRDESGDGAREEREAKKKKTGDGRGRALPLLCFSPSSPKPDTPSSSTPTLFSTMAAQRALTPLALRMSGGLPAAAVVASEVRQRKG